MTVLVVGATGATGRLLVSQLLRRGVEVRAVVRDPGKLPEADRSRVQLTVVPGGLQALPSEALAQAVLGCEAIVSCLGHTLSRKGIWGKPRRLVTDTVVRLCQAVRAGRHERPVKFALMSTAGYCQSPGERLSLAERGVMALVRGLLPPHRDNAGAAGFLRTEIGDADRSLEWVAVRPDTLTDEPQVSEYAAFPSPVRSALFNPGTTRRIHVAHFLAELVTDQDLWRQWKGKMPVLYDGPSEIRRR